MHLSGRKNSSLSPEKAPGLAGELLEKGNHRFVAITMGNQGVYLAEKHRSFHLPAFSVKAVDATAAGDTFCGALAVALGEGLPLLEAARWASAAAAIAVTRVGAQSSIPLHSEIEAFLLIPESPKS